MSDTAPKTGRPSKYTPQLGVDICVRIAEGESLRTICKTEGMPSAGTVCRWLFEKDKKEFQEQYARAREAQAEFWADELISLADDATDSQKARLQIDTRKWVAAKLLPKKYGERQQLEHTAPQLDDLVPSDPMEIARRMLFIMQLGAKQAAEQPTQR